MQVMVELGERRYPIEIGSGVLSGFDFRQYKAGKYFIITDRNVQRIHGTALLARLRDEGLAAELIAIEPGDRSKRLEVVGELCSQLARHGADRSSLILALGGGVVGDIAGFVAAVYLRGIRYVQIPTSLLAQVDSSIGGKTGVNLAEGKNLVGTISQPVAVVADTALLETLPAAEIRNGLAEVIKFGMILDAVLFDYVEQHGTRPDSRFFTHIVTAAARLKATVVARDEREAEYRKIFNYGHTIGHAIELVSSHAVPHGEAVAIGMSYEARIACQLGYLSQADRRRQDSLLREVGLPTTTDCSATKLIEVMRHDKKNQGQKIFFVLPEAIGRVHAQKEQIAFPVPEKSIMQALTAVPN